MAGSVPLAWETYYHIYNRGNNREDLFRSDDNYRYFLRLYADHIEPVAVTFAYCLMPNHFHAVLVIDHAAALGTAPAD
ncbi:MAG: transposase, partial [Anaerolineae bacterium]